ncbi:MAG: hypothetical protein P8J86_00135 [Phycisphaerales bacterium]|nr:hypothetical protein [Phycisphaerales bacterium]
MAIVSIIDIGTHSVRGLVAEITKGRPPKILSESRLTTRLGEGLSQTGQLSQQALERAVGAISCLCKTANAYQVTQVRAVATCAVREARNGAVLVDRVEAEMGIKIEVISPTQEVSLSYRGIRFFGVVEAADIVVADLGGGSLEIMFASSTQIESVIPTQLGAIRTTEMYRLERAVSSETELSVKKYIKDTLEEAGIPHHQGDRSLVMCGGAALAVAALMGGHSVDENQLNSESHRWNGTSVQLSVAVSIVDNLKNFDCEQRSIMTGLSHDRAAVIVAGIWALVGLMECLGIDSYVLSAYGIRGGILAELQGRIN